MASPTPGSLNGDSGSPSPIGSRAGSVIQELDAYDKVALSAVGLLDDKTRVIREQVMAALEDTKVTSKRLIDVMVVHDQDDLKRTLPLVMCGLINTVSKQAKMRESMRAALVELVEERGYDFNFNDAYERFYRGQPPRNRITSATEVTEKFFGTSPHWSVYLNLGSKYTSKVKELKVICELAELLNFDKEGIRKLLFDIRDKRKDLHKNTQGVAQNVTNEDLAILKENLKLCKAECSKKKRANPEGEEGATTGSNKKQKKHKSAATVPEEDDNEPCNPIGKPAELRNDKRTPKAINQLYRYAVHRAQAGPHFVQFKPWMDSALVHGHANRGQFRLDDQESGQLRVSRLVGFWDPLQRQEPDYYLSWIIIPPMSDGFLRESKWTELSRLVAHGLHSYDDLGVQFLKADSGRVHRILREGQAILISNVLDLANYPFGQRDIHSLLGRNSRCDVDNVREAAIETEDPNRDSIPAWEETFLYDNVSLLSNVIAELPALEEFYRSLEETLPLPKDDITNPNELCWISKVLFQWSTAANKLSLTRQFGKRLYCYPKIA
ncbi:hypothetical protein QFC21_007356 [Naganishia friedmannii]|uniref:Uncharacterized protein n=1 Tax=Naganishia friedmannii TaxID=89922 RepID=A0ACC2UVT7_9TREE|nr:hypothetical protein QFC21_007356 [Naganishia friedmannii]